MLKRISLIEVMVTVASAIILASLGWAVIQDKDSNKQDTYTPPAPRPPEHIIEKSRMVATECVEGYKFAVSRYSIEQIITESGGGIPCDVE